MAMQVTHTNVTLAGGFEKITISVKVPKCPAAEPGCFNRKHASALALVLEPYCNAEFDTHGSVSCACGKRPRERGREGGRRGNRSPWRAARARTVCSARVRTGSLTAQRECSPLPMLLVRKCRWRRW